MKKMMKRTLAFVLTLAMCFAFVPSVMAAEGEDPGTDTQQVNKIDKSKTADVKVLDRDKPETEITLSVPGVEYQNEIDIVFVMDSSSSTDLGSQFIESANDLFASVVEKNPNVNLKIGIILFTGSANDAIEFVSNGSYSKLTTYNDDTKALFSQSFHISENLTKDQFRDQFGRGSGPHVGLDLANQWLEEDSAVNDDNKYVILFTDGKGYIWANEEHEPTTIYTQYYTNNKYTLSKGGKADLSQVSGYNKASYSVDVLDPAGKSNIFTFRKHADGKYYYEDLYNSTSEELSGVTKWDQPCPYAFGNTWRTGFPEGDVTRHDITNGAELFGADGTYSKNKADYQYWYEFTPNKQWENLVFMEANPFAVIDNGDGKYTFDTNTVNPNYYQYHVDCLQKGIYKAGHLWKEMGENYNCAVVTYDSSTGGGLEMVGPFKEWLRNNSIYGASKTNSEQVAALFDGIDNDIRYLIGKGVVTDEITSPFNLKMDGYGKNLPFKLVVGKEEYEATAGEDNTWAFNKKTTPSEGNESEEPGDDNTGAGDSDQTPPYSVSWNAEQNSFTWNINVPVENANKLKLSYKLEWKTEGEDAGDPGVWTKTNGITTLTYWKSTNTTETADGTEPFDSPKVIYPLQVTYKANYEGGGKDIVDKGESTEKGYYAKNDKVELEGSNAFTRSGYTFSGWSTDANGSAQYQPGDTFENLTEDTTFYAIWTRNSNPPTPPVDIDDPDVPLDLNGADHFAYIEGYPDGTVQPGGNITRAEVSTMIYRLLTEDRRAEIFTDQNDYSDVEKPNWFNKAVSSMTVGKYVTGYPDGTFLPNQAITRAEFVTIVVRFLDGMKESENPFSDIDGHWAKDYILSAVKAGWIDGYPDGTFQPNKAITRAEAMKIMNTILHRGVNETSELGKPVVFPDNSDASQWYYYEVIEATNDHETEGERPDEQWKSNTIDYTYDIEKYERP